MCLVIASFMTSRPQKALLIPFCMYSYTMRTCQILHIARMIFNQFCKMVMGGMQCVFANCIARCDYYKEFVCARTACVTLDVKETYLLSGYSKEVSVDPLCSACSIFCRIHGDSTTIRAASSYRPTEKYKTRTMPIACFSRVLKSF